MTTNYENCTQCKPKPCHTKKTTSCGPIDLQGIGLLNTKIDKEIKDRTECCENVEASILANTECCEALTADVAKNTECCDEITIAVAENKACCDQVKIAIEKIETSVEENSNKTNCAEVFCDELTESQNEIISELCLDEMCDITDSGRDAIKQELIENFGENIKCTGRKILVFDSCDALAEYNGTLTCPLSDGMIAIVQNDDGCFDIYTGKWFTDNAAATNDGDACGLALTHHIDGESNKEFRWVSYEMCHPDVFVTGNTLAISGNTITSTVTRSDGQSFTDSVTITHPTPPTPVLNSYKVKMDVQTTLSIPTGVNTPYMLLGSSTTAPVTGWYQMSGATAGEITNYNTVCVSQGDARAEAFYQFKVGTTVVGEDPFQSSYATNVVNDKELVIAGGAGFSVYLTAGQKIDVYVSHRKHESAFCTATHNVYLEGLTYGLN